MRDEERLSDAERRLQTVLRSTDERVAAVAGRALAPRRASPWRRRRAWAAAAGLAVLMLGAVLWRASRPVPPALHIWGSGSVVVVIRGDGQRWMVDGGREPAPGGEYVIVVPQ